MSGAGMWNGTRAAWADVSPCPKCGRLGCDDVWRCTSQERRKKLYDRCAPGTYAEVVFADGPTVYQRLVEVESGRNHLSVAVPADDDPCEPDPGDGLPRMAELSVWYDRGSCLVEWNGTALTCDAKKLNAMCASGEGFAVSLPDVRHVIARHDRELGQHPADRVRERIARLRAGLADVGEPLDPFERGVDIKLRFELAWLEQLLAGMTERGVW